MRALANVYRQIGDLANARRMLEESLRIRPYFGQALMSLGTIAWDEGDRVAARVYFQRAVDANPLLGGAHLKLAIALHDAGEVERAFEEFELFVRYALPSEAAEAAQVSRMLRERRGTTPR